MVQLHSAQQQKQKLPACLGHITVLTCWNYVGNTCTCVHAYSLLVKHPESLLLHLIVLFLCWELDQYMYMN